MSKMAAFLAVISLCVMNSTVSVAQDGEGIWMPAPQEVQNVADKADAVNAGHSAAQSEAASADVAEGSVDGLLGRYVELQRDLYRLVVMFDEQARVVERNQMGYEKIYLKNQEIRMTTPNMPEPLPVPDATEGDELAPDGDNSAQPAGDSGLTYFKSPVLCSELDASLRRYIDKNAAEMERVSRALAGQSVLMSEAEKELTAEKLRVALAGIKDLRRAEEILFLCLYKYKNEYGVPVAYSVEKTLRAWFAHQEALVDAWIGNVD